MIQGNIWRINMKKSKSFVSIINKFLMVLRIQKMPTRDKTKDH